jgi:hypothetical protein
MTTGAFLQAVAYALNAAALPFPVLCLGYGINGIGMALQVSTNNDVIKLGVEDNESVGCSSKRIRGHTEAEAGEEDGNFARSLRSLLPFACEIKDH